MDVMLNPNVAYVLLVSGTLLSILAVISPGTGVLEVGALFILIIAGWEVYNLQVNYWALGILLLGVIPFIFAVRRSGQIIFLVIAIIAFLVGSIFLFRGESLWQPAVNPILALIVSILSTAFMWIVVTKVMEAESTRPTHDLESLVGKVGEVKSPINGEGSVQVAGELWSARSSQPIDEPMKEGEEIIVTGREGFILLVERQNKSTQGKQKPQGSS